MSSMTPWTPYSVFSMGLYSPGCGCWLPEGFCGQHCDGCRAQRMFGWFGDAGYQNRFYCAESCS